MKIKKGNFGYIKSRRKAVIVRTLIFFAISLTLFLAGLVAAGSRENILTIVAMLGLLPACKSLVEVVMFLKAKSTSEALFEETLSYAGNLQMAYELVLTSYHKNYPLNSVTCKNNVVCGFSEDADFDIAAAKKHISDILKSNAFKPGIELYKEFHTYCKRLEALNEGETTNPEKDETILAVIKAISI